MKILIVEDDKEAAAYLKKALLEAGHTVDHAGDGREGLFLGASETYDVIILDRMLPEMDGLAVLRTLRASDVATPVLLLTALGGIDDRVDGLEAGGDGCQIPDAHVDAKRRLQPGVILRQTPDLLWFLILTLMLAHIPPS